MPDLFDGDEEDLFADLPDLRAERGKWQLTAAEKTRAVVLHPDIRSRPGRRLPEHGLAEAVSLAAALPGLEVLWSQVVKVAKTLPGSLFGTGKVEEIGQRLKEDRIGLVFIDGPVTPVQQRNLEKEWKVKLLDRTSLILEIFADRARTREGVLQVELAALSYQRTRLVRAWTHLERQRGGFGFVGGPGETQKENDRRAIDDQAIRLRRQLEKVVKTRHLHRAARARVPFPIVALVGYTNAGKSTLFNRVTGAEVLAKDMLFATLDPTMRALEIPGAHGASRKVILSDTVGFISDLPTQLVAAFRATLEEVLSADLVLHVRDISHPETAEQAADVEEILSSLGLSATTPKFEIWNKLDLVEPAAREALEAQAASRPDTFVISALTGEGVDPLLAAISASFEAATTGEDLELSFGEGRKRAWLHEAGVVTAETQTEDGWTISVVWSERQAQEWARL